MAEFLIKAVDATIPDPTKDRAGCYKRGDVVVVMPNGHEWGKEEGPPSFIILKIPGLSVTVARKYLESEYVLGDKNKLARRRRYRLRVDDLPLGVKSELVSAGSVTVNWSEIKSCVQDKTELSR